jgi:hypothetical protein
MEADVLRYALAVVIGILIAVGAGYAANSVLSAKSDNGTLYSYSYGSR